MAQYSKFLSLISGLSQTVDLAADELAVLSITVGGTSGTNLTKTALDSLISNSHASGSDNQNVTAGDGLTGGGSGASPTLAVGAGNGISVTADAVAVAAEANKGIAVGAGGVSVDYDDITLNINEITNKLQVKNGGIANLQIDSAAEISLSKLAALTADRALISSATGVVSVSTVTATELGYVSGVTSAIQTQLNNLASLIQNFEWADSALDYIVDNTVAPPTETSGDRYVLSADGGAPHADWDGAEAGDIVQFNGTVWVETTPTTGMMISIDDEASSLRQWSGSAWSQKYFESTTASTGLTKVGFDVRLASSAAGAGLAFDTGVLSVGVDNSSIEIDTDALRVKALGVTNAMLAGSIADTKLSTISTANKVSGSAVQLKATGALEDSTGLAVKVDGTSITINASNQLEAAAASSAPTVVIPMVAGESFAANTSFLVRMALTGETAGRVYKATNAAAAADGKFYAFGIVMVAAGASAGDTVSVKLLGSHTLGSSDTAFDGADVGKPVFLTTGGAFSLTAPSTSATASYKVGNVASTSSIMIFGQQLMGIN